MNGEFSKFRELFFQNYNITGKDCSDVKFIFDGAVIKDTATPESLDMDEEDNVIDVIMNEIVFKRAMENIKAA